MTSAKDYKPLAERLGLLTGRSSSSHELVAFLDERNPAFDGLSSNEVIRIRGYVMAAFERIGLPDAALPYVLEELDSGRHAFAVAAAAAALRGGTRSAHLEPYLRTALHAVRYTDDAVVLGQLTPTWSAEQITTTAVDQIQLTLTWLAGDAQNAASPSNCCSHEVGGPPPRDSPTLATRRTQVPLDLQMQDQNQCPTCLGDFLTAAPLTLLTFFYTRCDNAAKCSTTITNLASLQQELQQANLHDSVQVAAVTYDPEFDTPPRLLAYGRARGFKFDEFNRFLRVPSNFAQLRDYLQLRVSYGTLLPNRHAIELYVLDQRGQLLLSVTRQRWRPDRVVAAIRELGGSIGDG